MHGEKALRSSFRPIKYLSPWQGVRDFRSSTRVCAVSQGQDVVVEVSRTRNIGIIAHIDAVRPRYVGRQYNMLIAVQGKTTTTERMLYYSGHTRRIGSM